MVNRVQMKLMDLDAIQPRQGTPGSAGFDMYASANATLQPWSRQWVNTGVKLAIPEGYYGHVLPRSGLAAKGIDVGAGIIDSDYRGEVKVLLINNNSNEFNVQKGDRISQLVFVQIMNPHPVFHIHLDGEWEQNTVRGEKGFGSTGI